MHFLYHTDAGDPQVTIEGENHKYLFRVRRVKISDKVTLRNLKDGYEYIYKIESINRRTALLFLAEKKVLEKQESKELHIGWCIIDPKSIEKYLPTINELGVAKISFIYCQRSQKSYKVDFKRLQKILINSSQQCGRDTLMEFELFENLKSYLSSYPQSYMLNFSNNYIDDAVEDIKSIVIGCEGGFTEDEISLIKSSKIVGLKTPYTLKSESAVVATGAKLLT